MQNTSLPGLTLLPIAAHEQAAAFFPQPVAIPNRAILFAVLEGQNPGQVWIDVREAPTRCMVVAHVGAIFIGGVWEQQALDLAIMALRREREIFLAWPQQGMGSLRPPNQYSLVFPRLEFWDRAPELAGDLHSPFARARNLPARLAFRRIDADLLRRCAWRDQMVDFCGSEDAFERLALGFCLLRDDDILCEAYASSRGAGLWEIGVVTTERERGKGYAALTCAQLILACEAQGTPTMWSCDIANTASAATARRLGYRIERPYIFYYYPHYSQQG